MSSAPDKTSAGRETPNDGPPGAAERFAGAAGYPYDTWPSTEGSGRADGDVAMAAFRRADDPEHGCATADRCVGDPGCEVYPLSRVCQEADAGRTVPDLKRERAPFQPFKVHLAEGMPADLVLVTSPRRDDECRREVCDHTHEVAVRLPDGMAGALDDHDKFAASLLSAPEARNAFQDAAYRRGVAEGARLICDELRERGWTVIRDGR